MPRAPVAFAFALFCVLRPLAGAETAASPGWWLREPVRFFQTNLPENFSTRDPGQLVDGVADFGANVLLLNMGGIAAQYPTEVELHYRSRWLPEGRDFFGTALQRAHARGLRVIGRFDLSKTQKPVFDARPEWFFKRVNGAPAIYNGLYSACINGGYYWEHAPKILTEALTRYPVDGLFFNMFGNPSVDYDGVAMGPCHCDACHEKYQQRHGRALPRDDRDPEYRAFMYESAQAVAANLGALIHRLRPEAAFLTYIDEHTDVIVHESNTSATRPLPLWPYSASDNVNRSLNSGRDKMVFNLCMSFVDYPWRFIHVSPDEVRLRLWQNLAHGGPPALVVLGSFDQEDKTSLLVARPIFAWHQAHEDLYLRPENAARVLLLYGNGGPDYRGFFRVLTEAHIPFAVTTDSDWLTDGRRDAYDLVIAPNGAPPELDVWIEQGGRLLVAGTTAPKAAAAEVVAVREVARCAWRVHDHALLPSLRHTKLIILDSEYAELKPARGGRISDAPGLVGDELSELDASVSDRARPGSAQRGRTVADLNSALTLIPPAMTGPPELVWLDKVETNIPGLFFAEHGRGRVAWIPWRPGPSYYRYSSPGHAGLIVDLVDHLLPAGRQLKTNAHPLVEITVMRQPEKNRTLVHLVNVSGHSSTGYFPPIATGAIDLDLAGKFSRARAVKLGIPLTLSSAEGRTTFALPSLLDYEVIVLE